MTLDDWLKSSWLKSHSSSAEEVEVLLLKVNRDIDEATKTTIGLDWRLAIAYNAVLGLATIALRVSGYRAPEVEGHHYRTIESLRYTLKPDKNLVSALQTIRKKRAVVNYDAADTVSEAEMNEALAIAKELYVELQAWLKSKFPHLLKP
ncbi:MAG: hypothetical protein SGI97_09710 [candidate division Zixibacteria bacterium]|nr:hypothetical protein [candidate division Zixibacteria bacterium]